LKNKINCKRPTKEKIIYQLGGKISEEEAERILNQMEQFCELLLEQIKNG
jgi:hypothetical protein